MKAAVYDTAGPPDVLRYVEVPDPVIRTEEVLVRVEAISIEGGDLIHRRATAPPRPAWVGGVAAAGVVAAVGSCVDNRKVGDRVAAFDMQGSHAELWAVPATRTWRVPAGVDPAHAAALPIAFGTAHHCLFARGGLQRAETVLIQAAGGGVGLAAVQLAAGAGAHVLAVASGVHRSQGLRSLGAYHVMDRTTRDIGQDVRRITHERGVDLVIDPIGTTLPASLDLLATEGRLVFVGNAGGGTLAVDLWKPMQCNQTLLGVFMGSLLEKPAVWSMVDGLFQAVAKGSIQVIVDRTFPLAQAAAAHHHAETAKPFGRVVMTP